jgi:hypothetical protein
MTRRIRPRWSAAVVTGVLAIGCGGNVVVDSPTSGAGGSATTGGGGNVPLGTSTGAGGDTTGGGFLTCADLFPNGSPDMTMWSTTMTEDDFVAGPSYPAYVAVNMCVCMSPMAADGCEDVCASSFCKGIPAVTPCGMCLSFNCVSQIAACSSN